MKLAKQLAGILLIIIGLLALVTPLTPGSWLIFVGLGLLGVVIEVSETHWFAKYARYVGMKVKQSAPPADSLVDKP